MSPDNQPSKEKLPAKIYPSAWRIKVDQTRSLVSDRNIIKGDTMRQQVEFTSGEHQLSGLLESPETDIK